MTDQHEPISCSLPLAEGARQGLEWQELTRQARKVQSLANGVAMEFPAQLADMVDDLARREAQCCSFLEITTDRRSDGVRLEISSDHPDAGPVIAMLTGSTRR